MADDAANVRAVRGDESNDAMTPIPPPSLEDLPEFPIQCKSEPDLPDTADAGLTNATDENDSLEFDDITPALHIPVSIPMIKDPIVLLERCDKIWETLQLIRSTVHTDKPTDALTDDCDKNEDEKNEENEEEKAECSSEVKQSVSYVRNQPRLRSDNTVPLPFKFSVQRTRKLYPCITCGKQYMERRSLRKHSERVHGVVIPLLIQRRRWKRALNKKNFTRASQIPSIDKETDNSEKLYDNRDSSEKSAKIKLTGIKTITSPPIAKFVKCTLCQLRVLSLRKHLINYHKIGGSSSMMEQLESSLLNETKTSGENKTAKTNEDGFLIMDNDNDTRGPPRGRKRKYTLSYGRKKLKLNNERYAHIQNPPSIVRSYKCDICLGMYSSPHSLYKHKRIHRLRGETKDNFHKFKCRYFNSPFNKKCRLLQSSAKSTDIIAKNANEINENDTLQLNNSKRKKFLNKNMSFSNRATRYSERINKNNETICLCGRSFRNPHTLFIHKKNCELYQIEDNTTQSTRASSDRDSGIGINITIKKRNDSYEIVGKDDEDKSQRSETHLKEDTMSHTSNNTKDFTKASKQQILDIFESSKYSKNHSILKLQDIDEDVIIDIEDDVQTASNENDRTKQMITQRDGKRQNDDTTDGKVLGKVVPLTQMCQDVLDVLQIRKSGNIEDRNKKYKKQDKIKDQETYKENNQIGNQEIRQENKRQLRSANKRRLYSKVELDRSYDGTKVCAMPFNSLMCGFCKEQFSTIKSFDNHQCTVKEGKSYNEFSLHLPCFCCKEILNNYNEFDDHVKTKHFDCAYHCYKCGERFITEKVRNNHLHTEHNDLVCKSCNRKTPASTKAYHEAYHLGYGFPCHKCKKAYSSNKNLSYHKYTIHFNGADNLVSCNICLKLVKLKTYRGHTAGHKHNVCYFCGKVFSDRVGLEYHTMMHHGTNSKLKCNICGTRFYNKKQLERHEKIDGCTNSVQRTKKVAATQRAKNR
ncbi:PREDICTED: uncharacterized protein LOC105451738 [Wasmannia auropunctata]|uniref:uncharacterized protein LOC105451738 n=1 Tax=Wasmannia auropunctata TaxID=64793 RepID=UPI0005F01977|nr:PREDICTED: uncharacterized protein LOC105451738 [Wasmannia auropunctata]XP_011690695.1 PREDICTED: uncharacterized protein LOC105451738 [Wasmannia auropunctata]